MPDVSSDRARDVRLWVALGCAQVLDRGRDAAAGRRRAARCSGSRRPRRRSAGSSTGSAGRRGWRSATRPGPGGFALLRLLSADRASRAMSSRRRWSRSAPAIGSRPTAATPRSSCACIAPAMLRFVQPPTPETEGLRDLVRCRDDLRCARDRGAPPRRQAAAAPRADLPRGQEVLDARRTARWVRAPAPRRPARAARARADADPPRRRSSASSRTLDAELEEIAAQRALGASQVAAACRAFAASRRCTALGLIAEIGDFAPLRAPARAGDAGWASPRASTPPAISSTAATSPRPATATPAGC